MDRSKVAKLARQALRFCGGSSTAPTPEGFDSPRMIALRTRTLCAERGPHEIAAAIGAPSNVEDPRLIAYLLCSATELPDEARELAVEQAIRGFEEYTPTASP